MVFLVWQRSGTITTPHTVTDGSVGLHPRFAYCSFVKLSSGHVYRIIKRARDMNRSDEQLQSLREGLVRGRASLTYGKTKGGTLADMEPFHDTASRFLQEVRLFPGPHHVDPAYAFVVSLFNAWVRGCAVFVVNGISTHRWVLCL